MDPEDSSRLPSRDVKTLDGNDNIGRAITSSQRRAVWIQSLEQCRYRFQQILAPRIYHDLPPLIESNSVGNNAWDGTQSTTYASVRDDPTVKGRLGRRQLAPVFVRQLGFPPATKALVTCFHRYREFMNRPAFVSAPICA